MNNNERAQLAHLNLKQAVHHAAKQYPGGIGAIAGTYGYNPHTFQQKINPSQPGCINLEEFVDVLSATRSPLILDAIGREANCAWIDVGQFENAGDLAVLDTVNKLVHSVGQLTGDLHTSLADGYVDERELARLEQDFKQLTAAAHAIIERAKQFMINTKK